MRRKELANMPTVVLMDSSLSMTRPVSVEGSEEFQRKNLAVHGLTMLFEHMATNYKLEFTSLVAFSSLWELMVPFTRDYNTLQVKKKKQVSCCVTYNLQAMSKNESHYIISSRKPWITLKTMIKPAWKLLYKVLVM